MQAARNTAQRAHKAQNMWGGEATSQWPAQHVGYNAWCSRKLKKDKLHNLQPVIAKWQKDK